MEEKDKENGNSDTEVNWICECGKINFGNFCVVCGKPRPLVKEEQQQVETSTAGAKNENVSQADDKQTVINAEILPQKARKERIKLGDKTILKIGIGIGIVAFVGLGIFVGSVLADNEATKQLPKEEMVQSKEENKPISMAEKAANASELSINGVDIGADVEKMHAVLGQENSIQSKGDSQYYLYDDVKVVVKNSVIVGLVSVSNNAYSKRGIHEGVSLQDVLSMYGDNYLKSKYEGLELYEYKFLTVDNKEGLLRFAYNRAEGKVQYISARIMEKANANKEAKTEIQHPAIQVLYNYHAKITDKKYKEAYDCLSWNFRKRMSYDGWVPGFKTTVSSVPSDVKIYSKTSQKVVLTFNLRAVDNPGGTRDFSGTAEMVNTKNGWKIDRLYHNPK